MRIELPETIRNERVTPVARGLDPERALVVAEGLQAGGLSTIEVTVEADGGVEAIRTLSGGNMTVGAGSVASVAQATAAIAAGATFLVSPHFDPDIVQCATNHGIAVTPGALTPTEIAAAWSLGVAAVKVFPASVGGPAYLRSVLAPFPDLSLIPTGGIDASNAAAFLDAGAVAIGVGSWLTGPDDPEIIATRAPQLVGEVV